MIPNKRTRAGYYDLGPIQIPPHAQAMVLEDRGTGTYYLVSFTSDPLGRLSINTDFATIERTRGVQRYRAYEEPVMDEDGEYRLFIRNAHIGIDYIPFPVPVQAADNAPPYARIARDERELLIDQLNIRFLHLGMVI